VREAESDRDTADVGQTCESMPVVTYSIRNNRYDRTLSKVDRGEEILRDLEFREFRVRHHDQLVRLESRRAKWTVCCKRICSTNWRSDFVSWDLNM
jgi:PP-loop superfamily ATP-utilizing enzyme